MSDLTALLAAIIANPEEDTPRLMYADTLLERGDDVHAELIRYQCDPVEGWRRGVSLLNPRRRKLEGWEFSAGGAGMACSRRRMEAALRLATALPDPSGTASGWCRVERGFVFQVEYQATDFLAHADALIWHPTQTQPCPLECVNGWHENSGSSGDWKCKACSNGRIPRPVPPTAQPIRKVKLTTLPSLPNGEWRKCPPHVAREFQLDVAGVEIDAPRTLEGEAAGRTPAWYAKVLAIRFPGVEFELPV